MKTIYLVALSAIAIGGEIAKAGSLIEVSQGEARDLLRRERARLATEDDAPGLDELCAAILESNGGAADFDASALDLNAGGDADGNGAGEGDNAGEGEGDASALDNPATGDNAAAGDNAPASGGRGRK